MEEIDMDKNTTTVRTDNRFAIIPHWLIFSGVSAEALRLYAVLTKYADNATHQAFPSRATLAADLGKKSVRSVDGYISELKEIGALSVETRKRTGTAENLTSIYTLRTSLPEVVQNTAPGGAKYCAENYTQLTKPTTANAVVSSIDESTHKPLTPPHSGADAKLHHQIGTSKEKARILVDQLVAIYESGNDEYDSYDWAVLLEGIYATTGADLDDAVANRRWLERFFEIMAQHPHKPRYAASRWLAMVCNYESAQAA